MYKTWTDSASDCQSLARSLEAHLNEYAAEIVSVSYAVADAHYVLAVYREIEPELQAQEEEAVTLAAQIIDQAQT